jgi:hypothetical protein
MRGTGAVATGGLFVALGGSHPRIGAASGRVYLLGIVALRWAPDTSGHDLAEPRISRSSTP